MKILPKLPDNLFTEDCHLHASLQDAFQIGGTIGDGRLDKYTVEHAIGYCSETSSGIAKVMFEYDGLLFWLWLFPDNWHLELKKD